MTVMLNCCPPRPHGVPTTWHPVLPLGWGTGGGAPGPTGLVGPRKAVVIPRAVCRPGAWPVLLKLTVSALGPRGCRGADRGERGWRLGPRAVCAGRLCSHLVDLVAF